VNGTRAEMGRLPKFMWLSAERVAEAGYRAVMKNQPICIPGGQYQLISAFARLLPMKAAHRLGEARRVIEREGNIGNRRPVGHRWLPDGTRSPPSASNARGASARR